MAAKSDYLSVEGVRCYFASTPKMGTVFSDFPWLFVDIVR